MAASMIMLLFFYGILKYNYRQINDYARYMPIHNTRVEVHIEKKVVRLYEISENRFGENFEIKIEDFIYMISINPESKEFREVLKLINNDASHKKIKDKLKTVNHSFICLITFTNKNKALTLVNINSEQEFENVISAQLHSSQVAFSKRKTPIEMKFIENDYLPLSDTKIFNNLNKQSKKYLSKGVTLIKVASKYKYIDSAKDHLLGVIESNLIKDVLSKHNLHFHLGRDGSLYGIVPNDRKRNLLTVQKSWMVKFESYFPKNKIQEYIDVKLENYSIHTYLTSTRDSNAINEALVYVNLVSDFGKEGGSVDNGSLILEASSIHDVGVEITRMIKDGKLETKNAENQIVERGIKSLSEVYIDYPHEVLDSVIKYSFKHKRLILEGMIENANKEAAKSKDQLFFVNVDETSLPEIHKYLSNTKIKDNLYIAFIEKERVKHFYYQIINSVKLLKEKEIKTIQVVIDERGPFKDVYRLTKSEFVLISKGLNTSTILSDNFKINLKIIEEIKEKNTRIITIK